MGLLDSCGRARRARREHVRACVRCAALCVALFTKSSLACSKRCPVTCGHRKSSPVAAVKVRLLPQEKFVIDFRRQSFIFHRQSFLCFTPTSMVPTVAFASQPAAMLRHRGRAHHPERPERLTVALTRLRASGLLDCCRELSETRLATDEELLTVHTPKHVQHVAAAARAVREKPNERALREPQGDGAIYYHEDTERAARAAVGSVLEATFAAVRGEVRSAFALVRPPGHHAEADEALGFCFFNGAAVAAAAARREHGLDRGATTATARSTSSKRIPMCSLCRFIAMAVASSRALGHLTRWARQQAAGAPSTCHGCKRASATLTTRLPLT